MCISLWFFFFFLAEGLKLTCKPYKNFLWKIYRRNSENSVFYPCFIFYVSSSPCPPLISHLNLKRHLLIPVWRPPTGTLFLEFTRAHVSSGCCLSQTTATFNIHLFTRLKVFQRSLDTYSICIIRPDLCIKEVHSFWSSIACYTVFSLLQ